MLVFVFFVYDATIPIKIIKPMLNPNTGSITMTDLTFSYERIHNYWPILAVKPQQSAKSKSSNKRFKELWCKGKI